MNIVAKIQGENSQLVQTLKAAGVDAKLVRGGIVVTLPESNVKSGAVEIPNDIYTGSSPYTLLIDCTEHGGGMTNTGSGTVVCGIGSGKALKPYYMPRGGHLACGTHAYFSVPNAVATVTAGKKSGNVSIETHAIKQDGNQVWIETVEIWSGQLAELPQTFDKFSAATQAAHQKANCYHCRCAHYIAAA